MIIYDADITGSLKINGSDFNLTSISSSIVTNSSSIASLELASGSYANSASFASNISANSASIASLETVSGSYANSASFASNISANSASIGSLNAVSSSYANSASFASSISANSASIGSLNSVSSSYLLNTTDTLTGDLTVTGNIIATTLNVQDVTASVVYSSGSNVFGSSSIDTQQFTGSIKVSGSVDLQAGDANFAGQVNITSAGSAHFGITNTNVNSSSQQYLQYVGSNGDYVFRNATDSSSPLVLAKNNNATFEGNVGIGTGTSSPSATLNIKSLNSLNSDSLSDVITKSEFKLQYRADDLSSMYFGGLGSEKGYLQSINNAENAGTSFSLNPYGGDIGIGTIAPDVKLHVNGGAVNTVAIFESTDNKAYIGLKDNGTTSTPLVGADDNDLFFLTNSTERMRIDSNGLVRIQKNTASTTEPLLKLSNANGSTTDGVKMIFEVANTSGNGGEIAVVRDGGSFNPYMTFNVSSGVASAPAERMRIAGTLITFPTITELRGDIGSNKFAIGNMGDASSQMMVSSRGFLTFNVSNTGSAKDATERMRITSSGIVQINTNVAKTSSSSVEFASFGQSNEATNYSALQMYTRGAATQADRSVFFQTIESGVANAGNIVLQPSGGKVGIGGVPTVDFEIAKSGARLKMVDGTNQLNMGLWDGSNYRFEGDANRPMFFTSYQGNINFGISGGTTFNVEATGVVVTGTLETSGNVTINGPSTKFNTDGDSFFEILDAGTNACYLRAGAGDEVYIGANNQYQLRLMTNKDVVMDNGGNLGIGTATPTDGKVQIKTASAIGYTPTSFMVGTNLRLVTGGTAASSVTTGVSMGVGGAAEAYIGAVQNSSNYADIVFQTYHAAYGERMRITSAGHLARNSKKVWNFTATKSFTEGTSSVNFFRLNFTGNQAVLANITLMSNNSGTGSRTMQSVQAMLSVSYQGYLPTMTEISKTPVSNNGSSYISAVQGANGSLTFLCDTTNNTTGTSNTTFVSVELISNGGIDATITVL